MIGARPLVPSGEIDMHICLRAALAALALVPASLAMAQSAANCPALPANTGLTWEQMAGPGFVFCRALRSDGSEAFAVTISGHSPFEPTRRNRAEAARIDGREAHWYRSQIATDPNAIARETLLEINGGNVAHISMRAADEEQKAQVMEQVQLLQFRDARLSSN